MTRSAAIRIKWGPVARIKGLIGQRRDERYLPPFTPSQTRELAEQRVRDELGLSLAEFEEKLAKGDLPDTTVVRSLAILAAQPK